MDDHRFDELTRALGAGRSRRNALRAAVGGLAAAVAGLAFLPEAEAKKRTGKKGKTQGKGKRGRVGHETTETPPPVDCPTYCNEEEKTCGRYDNGCLCGGCPEEKPFCVVDEPHQTVSCKTPPYCVPNGESGPCCSGYHRDGVCCSSDADSATAIIVDVETFNRISVNTPTTVITTISMSVSSKSKSKSKRRGRRRGGYRRGRK